MVSERVDSAEGDNCQQVGHGWGICCKHKAPLVARAGSRDHSVP